MIRYMDDVVWWADSRDAVRETERRANAFVLEKLLLDVKPVQIAAGPAGCCSAAIASCWACCCCRKRRYAECRRKWEHAFAAGEIDAATLQAGDASALADAAAWRHEQLRRASLEVALASMWRSYVGVGRKADADRVAWRLLARDSARHVRSAYRSALHPGNHNNNGFRCARAHDRIGGSAPEKTAIPAIGFAVAKRKGRRRVSRLRGGRRPNARRATAWYE